MQIFQKQKALAQLFQKTVVKQTFSLNQTQIQYPFSNENKKQSFFQKFCSPESYTAPATTNRWLMAIAPFMAHMCIGGPYAWSIIASAITKEYGVIVSAANDWSLQEATVPLSLCFMFQGLSAASVGTLQIKYGLRLSMLAASTSYFSGVLLGGFGIYTHSLPLVYLGYGVLAGIGVGTVYTPPVQALMDWFPDRKGLASGLCITGFGSGALVMAPVVQNLMIQFQKMPQFVGKLGSVDTYMESGRMFAKIGNEAKEVIVATATDLSKIPGGVGATMEEGLYAVGTGNTGAAAAIGVFGLAYTAILLGSSVAMKKPPKGYVPIGFDPANMKSISSNNNVKHTQVMSTPQFWSLMTYLVSIASGGFALMAVAKSMMVDQFSAIMPAIVTGAFATKYVLMLSGGNMIGRLAWTQLQDTIGSKAVYNIMTGVATPLYIGLPFIIGYSVQNPGVVPLYGFIGSTVVIISILGGVYATIPAYEAQIFGQKYVGPIHGKMLLGSTVAAMLGPNMLIQFRNFEERKAIQNLLEQVDPVKFQETFQMGVDRADELIKAKVITIQKLMTMVPPEVQDPSPFLYNSALYTLAGLGALAATAHAVMKPIDSKHFETIDVESVSEQVKESIDKQVNQNQATGELKEEYQKEQQENLNQQEQQQDKQNKN